VDGRVVSSDVWLGGLVDGCVVSSDVVLGGLVDWRVVSSDVVLGGLRSVSFGISSVLNIPNTEGVPSSTCSYG
jgi:hypothetical protein